MIPRLRDDDVPNSEFRPAGEPLLRLPVAPAPNDDTSEAAQLAGIAYFLREIAAQLATLNGQLDAGNELLESFRDKYR